MKLLSFIKETISTLCLFMIVVTILVSIIARAVFNRPLLWSIELTSVLVIWSVYLIFGINYNRGNHFCIDFFREKLPEKYKNYLDIFSDSIICLTLLVIVYYCVMAMKINFNVTTMAMDISVAYAYYLPVIIGSVSLLSYVLVKYWRKLKGE